MDTHPHTCAHVLMLKIVSPKASQLVACSLETIQAGLTYSIWLNTLARKPTYHSLSQNCEQRSANTFTYAKYGWLGVCGCVCVRCCVLIQCQLFVQSRQHRPEGFALISIRCIHTSDDLANIAVPGHVAGHLWGLPGWPP